MSSLGDYEFDFEDKSPIDLGIDFAVDTPIDLLSMTGMGESEADFRRKRAKMEFFENDGFDIGFDMSNMQIPFGNERGISRKFWDWGIRSERPRQRYKFQQKPRKKLGFHAAKNGFHSRQESVQVERPQPSGGYHKPFTKDNVAELENKPGIYRYYDKNKKLIYIGRSHVLKHRVQSYYQKDDFDEHPTKHALRKEIAYFNVEYKSPEQARQHEHAVKDGLKHNHN